VEAEFAQRADLVTRARERVYGLDALADSIARLEAVAEALPNLLLSGADTETASVDLMRRIGKIVEAFRSASDADLTRTPGDGSFGVDRIDPGCGGRLGSIGGSHPGLR
jgi:hypothetical protein